MKPYRPSIITETALKRVSRFSQDGLDGSVLRGRSKGRENLAAIITEN